MNKLTDILQDVSTVAIAGHVNPDGDCVGACMGLYLYLKDNFPQIQAEVYLEKPREEFRFITDLKKVTCFCDQDRICDLLVILDVSSKDRIGVVAPLLNRAAQTACIDHHITNGGLCRVNHVMPRASSTCEVLYDLLENAQISRACAEALYTGIVHDTGVFQYSNTSPHTMRVAANLMEKNISFSEIVDGSFYQKTYVQNQILGRILMESIMLLDGKCIAGIVRQKELNFYGLQPKDLDGMVSRLCSTAGIEAALFLYELSCGEFKVSMRSKGDVDVSMIASMFGGGGHVRASGCTMRGNPYDLIDNLVDCVDKQLTGDA